ncbi:MFS transporter [Pseudorhodoferax sp. Leaf265]|uniref:MFS transporter n=1 Tax=Pseudorhodoferax sp. Leaf265 TaxID=1736315 RepID=UPI0006F6E320|nr:MFS transporter [Pseudorhodoferax sp. Leaf265]KQP16208.1 MFS transporter [Pseudorhodoferax sp. Leaf265]
MHATTPSTQAATSGPARSATGPLLALAISSFGIGTTEFGPMGMLSSIAEGVDVSIPSAGLLVSAYAIGVTLGAPFMTLLLGHWSRRKALMVLMAIFTLGNLLSALAPGYASLMVARVVTSLTHGAFFGIGAVVAASLVPPNKQASAVATMFMGLTLANIGGVPAATWLSDSVGWRQSFAAIAALGVLAMLALRLALPRDHAARARTDVRAELRVLTRPVVLAAMLTTVLSSAAMFSLYTYISPALKTFNAASPALITGLLALAGVGFTIGNSLGGKFADRSVDKTLIGFLLLIAASMLAFPWLAQTHIGAAVGVLVWGIGAFAVVPPIQMRVMRAAAEAPGLASAVNIGAFNLGNAVGAAMGAAVLSAGLGYAAVMVAGAAVAILALLLVLWSARRGARQDVVHAAACC